jgi:hypothetical protein
MYSPGPALPMAAGVEAEASPRMEVAERGPLTSNGETRRALPGPPLESGAAKSRGRAARALQCLDSSSSRWGRSAATREAARES